MSPTLSWLRSVFRISQFLSPSSPPKTSEFPYCPGQGVGDEGLKTTVDSAEETGLLPRGAAEFGTVVADMDLARLIECWSELPTAIRRSILAIVDAQIQES